MEINWQVASLIFAIFFCYEVVFTKYKKTERRLMCSWSMSVNLLACDMKSADFISFCIKIVFKLCRGNKFEKIGSVIILVYKWCKLFLICIQAHSQGGASGCNEPTTTQNGLTRNLQNIKDIYADQLVDKGATSYRILELRPLNRRGWRQLIFEHARCTVQC